MLSSRRRPQPAPPVPVMTVSPILTGAQLAELQRKLGLEEAHPRAPSPEALLRVVEQYAEIRDRAGLERALGRLFHPSERPLPSKPGLEDLLSGETVRMGDAVTGWEEAVRRAADPLIRRRVIEERYVEAMLRAVRELGPYMVIAPQVAVPHARAEDRVLGAGPERVEAAAVDSLSGRRAPRAADHRAGGDGGQRHLRALSQLTRRLSQKGTSPCRPRGPKRGELLTLLGSEAC